jgi:hypothetical protein
MHIRRAILAACSAVLAASCSSPSGPTAQPPDARGVWSSGGTRTWGWSLTSVAAPSSWESSGCEGSLTITEQDGGSFGGRYAITCSGAGLSSGALLDGRVGGDGQLSFRLRADEGWAPGLLPDRFNPPCPVASDPGVYEGTLAGGVLSVRRLQSLDCTVGRVHITASFHGTRG